METWAYQFVTIGFVVLIAALIVVGSILAVQRGRKVHAQKQEIRQLMTDAERKLLIIEEQKTEIELFEIEQKSSSEIIKMLESEHN